MANEVRNYPKPNDTLRACYLPQEEFYQLFFEVNGNTKVVEPIYEPSFDCDGKYMKNIIYTIVEKVKDYGINFYDIANAIVECCKKNNQIPPKIMYD